ncbi:cytochrome P450 [Nocardioides marmoriginsengisoli]|uniref:Cytochrome P450 n=1 Tax=Nocardioides marmoriginsengisoli TaxID=661483 RepID=A0A3N0CHM9_9ACTN|nr:cytochrome P450 [Nocardioides marmoriginsengisoli]
MSGASMRPFDELDVSPLEFWSTTMEERDKTFSVLRRERPLSWHRPMQGGLLAPDIDGVWVATSHELIAEVSKKPEIYSSAQGINMEDLSEDIVEAASSMLGTDPPKHGSLRKVISSAFTPKRVSLIQEQIEGQAARIVDDLLKEKEGDFVKLVSKRLPMWTVFEMLGLEEELREETALHAEELVSWNDDDVAAGRQPMELLNGALVSLLTIGMEFAGRRRAEPKSDLMTALVQAEVDGRKLTDDEIGSFFVLLSVAGNDTTRNTTTIAARALQDFPVQRALLMEDFDGRIGGAIEEFVRWTSPVMSFRRTVTEDTVLGGHDLLKGDWVVMLYTSGNRDESVFVDPWKFDITRSPNPHQGFGGGGPHFCMGNFVAKMQLRAIFDQLLHRAPNLRVGDPDFLTGSFVRSVKSMPCTVD